MRTIAESLLEFAAVKQELIDQLTAKGVVLEGGEPFGVLAEMVEEIGGGLDTYIVNLLSYSLSTVEPEGEISGFESINGATITQDLEDFWEGFASLSVVTPNVRDHEGVRVDVTSRVQGENSYDFSAYVKGTGTIWLEIEEISGATHQHVTLTDEFQRISVVRMLSATPGTVKLNIYTPTQQGITFKIDALMLKLGDGTGSTEFQKGGLPITSGVIPFGSVGFVNDERIDGTSPAEEFAEALNDLCENDPPLSLVDCLGAFSDVLFELFSAIQLKGVDFDSFSIPAAVSVIEDDLIYTVLTDPPQNMLTYNQSSIEVNTSGFDLVGSPIVTRDTSEHHSGLASLKIVAAAGEGVEITGISVSASTDYYFTYWCKGTGLIMDTEEDDHTLDLSNGHQLNPDEFEEQGVGFSTTDEATELSLRLVNNGVSSITFYLDDLQLIQSGSQKPWLPGGILPVLASEIPYGKAAYVNGELVVGTLIS